MDEMTFGMDFGQYQAERGVQAPEPGIHIFRITRTGDLKEQQKGINTGARCFSAWCEALDGSEPSGRGISKFIGFGTNKDDYGRTQIGEWIAFAEDLGRTDMLQASAKPDDLIGTEFEAKVKVSAKGNPYLVDVKGLEVLEETEEAEAEEEGDDTPPPRAAGRKGRR